MHIPYICAVHLSQKAHLRHNLNNKADSNLRQTTPQEIVMIEYWPLKTFWRVIQNFLTRMKILMVNHHFFLWCGPPEMQIYFFFRIMPKTELSMNESTYITVGPIVRNPPTSGTRISSQRLSKEAYGQGCYVGPTELFVRNPSRPSVLRAYFRTCNTKWVGSKTQVSHTRRNSGDSVSKHHWNILMVIKFLYKANFYFYFLLHPSTNDLINGLDGI